MERADYRMFIEENGEEILEKLNAILKNDPLVLRVAKGFQFAKKGSSQLLIKLNNGETINIIINPKSFPTRISIDNVIAEYMERYIANTKKYQKNRILEMVESELSPTFFSELELVIMEKMEEERLKMKFENQCLVFQVKPYKITVETPLEKCWNYKSFLHVIEEKIWKNHTIPVGIELTCTREKMLERTSEEIVTYLKTNKFPLQNFKNKKLEKRAKEIYETFETQNDKILINKKINERPLSYCFTFKEGAVLHGRNDQLDLQLSGRKVTVTTLGGFHNLFETVQTQEFQIAKTQINKYFEENQFHFTKIEGPGLYMGKTIVYYKKEKITINCPYKKNRWFETLQTKLDKTIKNILELQNTTMSYFGGQFIVHDILDCVEWNEDYITDSAIARQLRTMGRWDDHSSSRVYYENYSATEIKEIIQELIMKDFLTTRTHKGRYGKFETLKLGSEKLNTVEISDFDEFEEEKWNDYKAEYIFEKYTKKETLELKEYLVLLKFVDQKGFLAKYNDSYLSLLKTGPDTFKKVIKMKIDTETDDTIKKFYRKILKK